MMLYGVTLCVCEGISKLSDDKEQKLFRHNKINPKDTFFDNSNMITTASNLDFVGAPFSKTNYPNIWRKDMIDIGKMGVQIITEQNLNY